MTLVLLLALTAAAPFAAAQGTVLRCEGAGGKVTYAQNNCPAGTQVMRTLDKPDQPNAADRKAAQARARGDAKALEKIEREAKAEKTQYARSREADRVRAEARARTCRRLELRLKQARDDAAAAPLNRASETKRKVQKAQENYDLECGPRQ